jgi:uncharacterized protein (DUF302 family)
MNNLGFEKTITATMQQAEDKITEVLKEKGFGILTKIDFSAKMKEKLGKEVRPTVILGACNPSLAYEAYSRDQNMLLLVPCNVTLEQVTPNEIKIGIIKPTTMLKSLERPELIDMAKEADEILDQALNKLN